MKCSVFIATSADGYIATKDGNVKWLETADNSNIDMGDHADMGMVNFMKSVDCMIMGRKCMEKLSSFNLTPEQWPYGDIKIYALSNTVKEAPPNLKNKVEMYSGNIPELIERLKKKGYKNAYIDGGITITSFLNLDLINEITITQVPILLGSGKPLFGKLDNPIQLESTTTKAYPNNFMQFSYKVKPS